jgi:hypothetical protein
MQNYGPERGIIWIRQCIDECVHRVSAHGVIINACSIDELAVKIPCKKRIRQLTEELLQQTCNAVDVVLECFWVAEVDLRGV